MNKKGLTAIEMAILVCIAILIMVMGYFAFRVVPCVKEHGVRAFVERIWEGEKK